MCNKYFKLEASVDFLIEILVSEVCVVQYLMIVGGCCMRPASDSTAAADTADLLQTRKYCFR